MTNFNMSQPQPCIRHHHRHNLKHRFELIKTLGQGTYGKVKLAVDRLTGEKVAIKSIRKKKIENEQDLVRIKREIEIMSSLNHTHVIDIHEVFENQEKIILVMEYASGGELYDYISEKTKLTEKEARTFFRQIVSAVHHCHQNGIVHRDLKLENILLDRNNDIKIADFGLSNLWSTNSQLMTFCGSPLYASPEIVNGLPYYGPEVDCWSLGVLLYTLVYGAMPFDGSDFRRLRKQISEGDYYEPSQPSDASDLIRHLLTISPAKRATIEDISAHWWTNLHHDCSPIETATRVDSAFEDQFQNNFPFSSDSENDCATPPCSEKIIHRTSDFFEEEVLATELGIETRFEKCKISDSRTVAEPKIDEIDSSKPQENIQTLKTVENNDNKVFDSQKKPKKSILKNKGKYTGSDSGCVLTGNRLSTVGSDISQSESGDCKDNDYDLGDIEAILDQNANNFQMQSNHDTRRDSGVESSSDPSTPDSDLSSTAVCEAAANTAVVKRRSILKKNGRYTSSDSAELVSKRYSIGSLSSTSSGDILDFSYDSSDGEKYMGNAKYYIPPEHQQFLDSYYGDTQNGRNNINLFGDSRDEICDKIEMLDKSVDLTPTQSYEGRVGRFDVDEAKYVHQRVK